MNKSEIKIILASDHAGYQLKNSILEYLKSLDYDVFDVGAHKYVEDDDYPVYMSAAALKVAEDMVGKTKAIIFGGSGQGEAIVANRFPGVRAIVWYGDIVGAKESIVELSRKHNDSNVLSIGARFVDLESTKKAVKLWLDTPFSEELRHARRNQLIDSIE